MPSVLFNILVPCSNTDCHHINKIATGKKHGRVWDANTKLATGKIVLFVCIDYVLMRLRILDTN